jgi:hypothetical protein
VVTSISLDTTQGNYRVLIEWFNNHYKTMVEMGLPKIYGKKGLNPFLEYQPLLVKAR